MAYPRGQRAMRVRLAAGLLTAACVGACTSGRLDRGDVLLRDGNYAAAIRVWEGALATAPRDTRLLIRIATAQARLSRLDDAEATLRRALAVEPRSPKILQNLGVLHMKQKRMDDALETFHKVLAIQPTYPNTNYFVGLIHDMQGDEKTARDYYVREVNHGASLGAWDRLWALNEKTARPRPDKRAVVYLSLALLALAALAYGVRLWLDLRRGAEPSSHGVQ